MPALQDARGEGGGDSREMSSAQTLASLARGRFQRLGTGSSRGDRCRTADGVDRPVTGSEGGTEAEASVFLDERPERVEGGRGSGGDATGSRPRDGAHLGSYRECEEATAHATSGLGGAGGRPSGFVLGAFGLRVGPTVALRPAPRTPGPRGGTSHVLLREGDVQGRRHESRGGDRAWAGRDGGGRVEGGDPVADGRARTLFEGPLLGGVLQPLRAGPGL
mmetsp:Transcript_69329/g.144559  ORF Transcript_69329/g.144559 Transcript_69329/m.144559 type:complete len:220 (+) Transcript_69329:1722-2381(+)